MSLSKQVYTSYKHTQGTASDTWVIQHDLGIYPIVDVFVDVDGSLNKIIPSAVTYVDGNSCTIAFSEPYAGFATVA